MMNVNNGALASSNMELMTNALGLGTFFSGFFVRAAQGNKKYHISKMVVSILVQPFCYADLG